MSDKSSFFAQSSSFIQRRSFLKYAGATAGTAALVLAGCKDDAPGVEPANTMVEVGSADNGVLNYAYALEQLEAAFYLRLRTGLYYTTIATAAEKQILDDLAKHEKTHVDFLKSVIPSGSIIKTLEVDFSSINFDTRQTVLMAAMTFEDLGVAAYNGAARYLTNPLTVLTLGKIVSVEARHAALIRDLLTYNSFTGSDVVTQFVPASGLPGDGTGTGLEISKTPARVIELVNPFLKDGSKLVAASLA
ncbi:ferritin-like domain-containing protein [Hymenobacter sp. ASUV-10]|uniref:Ferritin-like domain-containing protein n=1 Tax=Hymenobacter aranciens TaxID=3063996 RepID=A0ABT9B8V3_9BACT|nr:ferritin-like domain-containing protein [Hymenobacter sp. ASUV-10]MDO7874638.1 ferritin-like domain-containing protein [Hymenobacter sp. ASUV-10]